MPLFRIAWLGVLLAAALAPAAAQGFYLYHDFPAGFSSTTVWSPQAWLWSEENIAADSGRAVLSDAASPWSAWRVTDSKAGLPNPRYATALDASSAADAAREGWRFAAFARYVDDFGDGPNQGLSLFLGNREYSLLLDLTAQGALQATLFDEAPKKFTLTTAGQGTSAFRNFALQSVPGTSLVDFFVDGVRVNAGGSWDGRPFNHPDAAAWGNSDRAGAARGVMDFHYVVLEIGSSRRGVGDLNVDGNVDGRDLLWWQRTLGSASEPLSDADGDGVVGGGDLRRWEDGWGSPATSGAAWTAVPEPGASCPPLVLGALAARRTNRRARRRMLGLPAAFRSPQRTR
jgi:hypothetical protein